MGASSGNRKVEAPRPCSKPQKLLFKSRYAIVTPYAPGISISHNIREEARRENLRQIAHETLRHHDLGLILRSVCATVDNRNIDKKIAEDISAMANLAARIRKIV